MSSYLIFDYFTQKPGLRNGHLKGERVGGGGYLVMPWLGS